jgi:hypothetical protein
MVARALVALAVVVSSGGCDDASTDDNACQPPGSVIGGPDTGAIGNIDYLSTGGFTGAGDGSSLHVGPDGASTRRTRTNGTEQFQLDATTLASLVELAEAARFSTLCSQYVAGSDFLTDVIRVEIAGHELSVAADRGATVPARLQSLIDALRTLTSAQP